MPKESPLKKPVTKQASRQAAANAATVARLAAVTDALTQAVASPELAAETTTYIALRPVMYHNETYLVGDVLDLPDFEATHLLATAAIALYVETPEEAAL